MDQGSVVLVGRLTREPKFFGEDNPEKQRALFSIAFNRGRDDKRKANFIDCIAWGKRADIMRDFKQGSGIFVTGDLEQDTYEKDGEKKNRIQVNVNSITATTSLRKPQAAGAPSGGGGRDVSVGGADDSVDIPF